MPVIETCPTDLSLPQSKMHVHILSSLYQSSLPITADKVALVQPQNRADIARKVCETD